MSGESHCAPRQAVAPGARILWHRTLLAKGADALKAEHLHFKTEGRAPPALHCLLVDCSRSMLSGNGLALAKGVLQRLIQMSYEQRAEVAIVGFSGAAAQVHVAPTLARPVTSRHVETWLRPIRGGGATPFASGVVTASNLLTRAALERPQQTRWIWLLTDGRTLETPDRPAAADEAVIVDCDRRRIRVGQCRALAQRWGATYRPLADFATRPVGKYNL